MSNLFWILASMLFAMNVLILSQVLLLKEQSKERERQIYVLKAEIDRLREGK